MGIKNRVGDQKEGADESPLMANRKLCSRNNPCKKKKRKLKIKEAREDKLKSESKLEQTGLERELVSSSLFFFLFLPPGEILGK